MIFQKLRSQAGASLIAALFLTLFCATVGAILLSAASANAGRISQRSQRDHDYYKVISAAKLFADQIRGKSVKVILTRSGGGMDVDNPYEYMVPTCSGGSDKFDAFLIDAVQEIYCRSTDGGDIPVETREKYWHNDFSTIIDKPSVLKKITITVPGDTPDPLSTIYGRIIFQGWNCVLKAMFSADDIPDDKPLKSDAYVVQMTCVPDINNPPNTETHAETGTETKTITFTWNNVQIMEGR